jgi:hypothetical protein
MFASTTEIASDSLAAMVQENLRSPKYLLVKHSLQVAQYNAPARLGICHKIPALEKIKARLLKEFYRRVA